MSSDPKIRGTNQTEPFTLHNSQQRLIPNNPNPQNRNLNLPADIKLADENDQGKLHVSTSSSQHEEPSDQKQVQVRSQIDQNEDFCLRNSKQRYPDQPQEMDYLKPSMEDQ